MGDTNLYGKDMEKLTWLLNKVERAIAIKRTKENAKLMKQHQVTSKPKNQVPEKIKIWSDKVFYSVWLHPIGLLPLDCSITLQQMAGSHHLRQSWFRAFYLVYIPILHPVHLADCLSGSLPRYY